MRTATIGAPLPKDEPALFGWEGITTVTNEPTGASPAISISLKPAAAQAFADYTTANVGDTFAVVVDGRVAMLPTVEDAITSGQIAISPAPGYAFTETAAILVGGELPEAWRGTSVPTLISREQAEANALRALPGATVQDAKSSAGLPAEGLDWEVVWNVEVDVPECSDLTSCAWSPGPYVVKVDAVTGNVIERRPQPIDA